MATGKIEYAPDYKSKHPKLPKNFGIIEAICADGGHRFLPDAPKCGCAAKINPTVEHERLRSAVVEAAKAWRSEENAFPYSIREANADYVVFLKAVDALNAFEASHAVGQKDGE